MLTPSESRQDDDEAIQRVAQARAELYVALQVLGDRAEDRGAPPHDRNQLVEKQDQAEGSEHLIEVVARIQRAQRDQLDDDPDHQRSGQPERHAQQVRARHLIEVGREIRSDHVKRAVREVDEVHDAEDEREPRGHQEQRDPELHPVQGLFDDKDRIHAETKRARSARALAPSLPFAYHFIGHSFP
jgi:hypothetical protein